MPVSEGDLLISGGQIATAAGLRRMDLLVEGGRIAAWLAPAAARATRERIDASGLVLLPGLVDAHVHFRDPGLTHKEDFTSGTAAAAAGGVTTALVMPTDLPATFAAEDLIAKARLAQGRLHVDIGLQAAATGPEQIGPLAAAGAVSVEIFLGDIPAHLLMPDAARLGATLDATRAAGLVAGISPAHDAVVAAALAGQAGSADPVAFFRSRPVLSEALGTALAIAIAADRRAPVHMRQISCQAALGFVQDARRRGLDITAETTPHYLLLDEEEIRRQGPFAKVLPPLRPVAEAAALWAGLRDLSIDMVATDHAPHAPEEKRAGLGDIWAAPGGFPGVQTLLPLMLDAVASGRIAWKDLLRLCCEAPAKRFGLYPRKGSLEPGADADIVLLDPGRRGRISNEDQLSRACITPFAGRETTGWPVLTLLRGEPAARDGRPAGACRGEVLRPFGRRAVPGGS